MKFRHFNHAGAQDALTQLAMQVPLTQVVASKESFSLVLRGFYLVEEWDGGSAYWLGKTGEIFIVCLDPEALLKISFTIVPSASLNINAPTLRLMQGEYALFSEQISNPRNLDLYISLVEGVNPINCIVDGEVRSPFETSGAPDSRQISFAFHNIRISQIA